MQLALSQNKTAMLEKEDHAAHDNEVTPEESSEDFFVLEFLDIGIRRSSREECS